ncbi:nucleotidyltransferase domain-containing protein [Nonomuraea sp. NPDC049695]|uniref:nucleotidyltransferase domain-containing protein n=1 Tax=Nonomuraea sp. NPDC049695 TaxID=3154734 RepID=UPI00341FA77F
MQHHDETLGKYLAGVRPLGKYLAGVRRRPHVLAVILSGSVARGDEREDSDADVYLVVTDESFEEARKAGALSTVRHDVATYSDGYIDVKVISLGYLDAAAERAEEPARAPFQYARVAWSRVEGLHERISRIAALPEAEWRRREQSHIAAARLYGGYFLPQADKLDDPLLRQWAALHLVTAAGRALLARQHVLFEGPKYLSRAVREIDRPTEYDALVEQLLAAPRPETAFALLGALESHQPAGLGCEETLGRFVQDDELAWFFSTPPPERY